MSVIDRRILQLDFDNASFERNAQQSMKTLDQVDKKIINMGSKGSKTGGILSNLFNKDDRNFLTTGIRTTLSSLQGPMDNVISASQQLTLQNASTANSVDVLADRFSALGIVGMSALNTLTEKAIGLAGKVLGALPNAIIGGGFNRAMAIEQARFTLQGLLKDEAAAEKVLEVAKESVNETAYSSAQAATVAANLASSGITDTTKLAGVMNAIAGVTATVNGNYESMGHIFAVVAGQGRLMGMQLQQLSLAGMNAAAEMAKVFNEVANGTSGLSEESQKNIRDIIQQAKESTSKDFQNFDPYNITEQNLRDMVSASMINFQAFSDSMQAAFGENAKKANETFTGSMANINAALARTGEMFFNDLIRKNGPLVEFFNNIRIAINGVNKALAPVAEFFKANVEGWFNGVNRVLKYLNLWNSTLNEGAGGWEENANAGLTFMWRMQTPLQSLIKIAEAIKQTFFTIFPKSTDEQLLGIITRFRDWMGSLKVTNSQLTVIKNIASGVFTVFKMLGKVVEFLWKAFVSILKALSPLGDIFASLVRLVTFFILKISKGVEESGLLNNMLDALRSILSVITPFLRKAADGFSSLVNVIMDLVNRSELIQTIFGFISSVFSKIAEVSKGAAKTVTDFLYGFVVGDADKINGLGNAIGGVIDKIKEFLHIGHNAGGGETEDLFGRMAKHAKEALGPLGEIASMLGESILGVIKELVRRITSFSPGQIITGVFALIQTAILLNINKMFKGLGKITNGAAGTLFGKGGLAGWLKVNVLEPLKMIGKYALKIQFVKQMAQALLMMAVALFMLSLVDPVRLGAATAAMVVLSKVLVGMVDTLDVMALKPDTVSNMAKLTPFIIGISAAILLLSFAVKKLGSMDILDMTQGIAGTMAMLYGLFGVIKLLNKLPVPEKDHLTTLKGMMPMLIGFGISVLLLASAVKKLGQMDPMQMTAGLIGVGGLLGALGGCMAIVGRMKYKVSAGKIFVLISFAIAIMLLARQLKSLGEMNPSEYQQGLIGVLVLLATLTACMEVIGRMKQGVSPAQMLTIIAFAVAVAILVHAILPIAELPLDNVIFALTAVVAMLGMLSYVMLVIGQMDNATSITDVLVIISMGLALEMFASAMQRIGAMRWQDVVKGLAAIASGVFIIAEVSRIGKDALKGAMLIGAVGGALVPIALAMSILASKPWGAILAATLSMSAVITIIVLAASVIDKMNLEYTFMKLGAAMLFLGAGIMMLGAGIALIGSAGAGGALTGLLGVVAAMAAFSFAAIALEPFIVPLQLFAGVLTKFGIAALAFGAGLYLAALAATMFIGTVGMIIQTGSSSIAGALAALLDAIAAVAGKIADTIGKLILEIVRSLHTYGTQIAQELLGFLVDIINILAQNIGPLADALWNLGAAILQALWNGIMGIGEIAGKAIKEFVDGFHIDEAIHDFFEFGGRILAGFFGGILNFLLNNPVTKFFGGIVDGVKNFLGIGDEGNSTVFNEMGVASGEGYVDGLNSVDATEAGMQLSEGALNGISSGASEAAAMAAANIVDGFSGEMTDNSGTAENAGENVGEAAESGAGSVSWNDTAFNTVQGFANGLGEYSYLAENAGRNLADNTKTAINNQLGVKSPSKVLMETGMYAAQGFAIGMLNNIATILDASRRMGETANQGLAGYFDDYGINFDATPTIRPIMDLTDIYAGVAQMHNLINGDQIASFASVGYNGSTAGGFFGNNNKTVTYQLVLDGAVYNDIPEIENVVGNAFEIMGRYRGMNYG